jgi:hypothetical protein
MFGLKIKAVIQAIVKKVNPYIGQGCVTTPGFLLGYPVY